MDEEATPIEGEEVIAPEETEIEVQAEAQEEAPKKNNIQKRIDTISRQKYEAIQRSDLLEKQNAELQAKLDAVKVDEPEPTLENHDYDEDAYNRAVVSQQVSVGVQRALADQETKKSEQAASLEKFETAREFAAKQATFSATVEDYDEITTNEGLAISDSMLEVINKSENGPALAYYLGNNLDQAYAIFKMDQYSTHKALIAIESNFAKPKLVSDTPAPIPGDIGGSSDSGVSMGLNDNLSNEEWQKRRNKQLGR